MRKHNKAAAEARRLTQVRGKDICSRTGRTDSYWGNDCKVRRRISAPVGNHFTAAGGGTDADISQIDKSRKAKVELAVKDHRTFALGP